MADDWTDETVDLDAARAFATYRNYLTALSIFTEDMYSGRGDLLKRLAAAQGSLGGFGGIRRLTSRHGGVRELLFNAWHTELALGLPQVYSDPGLIRFTNQWAPVQAYYAVYSLWRAWFLIEGRRVRNHAELLRSTSTVLRERGLLPPPWSYVCSGGHLLKDTQHLGFQATTISDVKNLSNPAFNGTGDDWASKTLRTTRRFFLERREGEWKGRHRTKSGQEYRRIPSVERQLIRTQLYPTTLFDFLYRLRIRSNYRDVDDFVSGQLDDADALKYFESLLSFTRSTMLLLEAMLRARMAEGEFDRQAQQFLSDGERSRYSGLGQRIAVLKAIDPARRPHARRS